MKFFCLFVMLSVGVLHSDAAELEALTEPPWLGFWVGYESSKWDAGIGTDGKGIFFLKKDKKRTNLLRNYEIIYLLEEKTNGKWVRPKMVKEGFETETHPTRDPKEVEFVATYTSGTQARFKQSFSNRELQISAELVTKSEDVIEARVGIRFRIPPLFKVKGPDEEEREYLEKKLEDEGIEILLLNGQKHKIQLFESVSLQSPQFNGIGAQMFQLKTKLTGGRQIELELDNPRTGKLFFEQTKPIYQGFEVLWYPEPNQSGGPKPTLNLTVK